MIQDASKRIALPPLIDSKSFALDVTDINQQKHRTWLQMRITSGRAESPNITLTLTKDLKSGSPVDSKSKLLSFKGEKSIKLKAIEIKLHLRNDQDRHLLNKTFGSVRWTYNECVKAINTKDEDR